MSLEREIATAFVESYGRTWESWDVEGFVELFSEEVVYVAHPQETVVGRDALRRYLRKEQAEQGDVSVRMGHEIVEGRPSRGRVLGHGRQPGGGGVHRRLPDRPARRVGRALHPLPRVLV